MGKGAKKFLLILPVDLWESLEAEADRVGESVSTVIRGILRVHLAVDARTEYMAALLDKGVRTINEIPARDRGPSQDKPKSKGE